MSSPASARGCDLSAGSGLFEDLGQQFASEQERREEIRSIVRELELESRSIQSTLQALHHPDGLTNMSGICSRGRSQLPAVGEHMKRLASLIPVGEFYRYHDHWRNVTQRLVAAVALLHYLETGGSERSNEPVAEEHGEASSKEAHSLVSGDSGAVSDGTVASKGTGEFQSAGGVSLTKDLLVSLSRAASALGLVECSLKAGTVAQKTGSHIAPHATEKLHLDLEDYLTGILMLASELSRLAVNSVTAGDFRRPMDIAAFLRELDTGFRALNLKNDFLRKRYDGLKYDVKRAEEVVYDITIRGLKPVAMDEKARAESEVVSSQ